MKRTFTMQEGSTQKFWTIEVDGMAFTVTYGRIGTKGQTSSKSFESEKNCLNEANKLIGEKLRKGYVEINGESSTDRLKNITREKIWEGCILSGIAAAVCATIHPDGVLDRWVEKNIYLAENNNISYIIEFYDDAVLGIMHNNKNGDEKEITELFKNAPSRILELAKEAGEYLAYADEHEGFASAAFWIDQEAHFSEDSHEDFVRASCNVFNVLFVDVDEALKTIANKWGLEKYHLQTIKAIYKRKIANPDKKIKVTEKEIESLEDDAEDFDVCIEYLAGMDILLEIE